MSTCYGTNMDTSYAFKRPVAVAEHVPKKTRRSKYDAVQINNTTSTFKYICYTCRVEMDIVSHDTVEIECANCGGRILKKRASQKPRVLAAV